MFLPPSDKKFPDNISHFYKVLLFFSLRYENGHVGDVHINTQEDRIHREILQVIASKPC